MQQEFYYHCPMNLTFPLWVPVEVAVSVGASAL